MNAQAIKTEVVEVRYADPPREGKKQATLKTPAGDIYGMKPEMLGLFRKGNRYRIDYTERAYQGRTFRTIVKVEPEASGDARAPSPGISSEPHEGAISRTEAYFVTTCMAASISSMSDGRTQEDMINRVKLLRAVYREGFK